MRRCAILLLVLALPLVASGSTARKGEARIFFLDLRGGKVVSANPDATDRRVLIDGGLTTIVPVGKTFTGKQLVLDKKNGKLYWSDREGMRVMRANLDGSGSEILVEPGRGDEARKDQRNWCVGMAVDLPGGKIYWTQKGGENANTGSVRRANLNVPHGQTAATRTDIDVLFDRLPEPIDLELDLANRHIYWTDRGDAPKLGANTRR